MNAHRYPRVQLPVPAGDAPLTDAALPRPDAGYLGDLSGPRDGDHDELSGPGDLSDLGSRGRPG
jgi:hypothetical protein